MSIPPYKTDGDIPQHTEKLAPTVEVDPLETAKWTQHLPETFGIRETIRASNYRWCARESGMWGIATGSGMTLHRLRMGSRTGFAVNMGVLSACGVAMTSYYFCCKRRDYKERMIEVMMKLNAFDHASQMPEETPLEEHPFAKPGGVPDREFRGFLQEKKEWQPKEPTKDMKDVFADETPRGGSGGGTR